MAVVKAWKATALTSNAPTPQPITGFKTFQSQVAGHLEMKNKPCFLVDKDGHVLKMVDFTRSTGIVETAFFERIFNADDEEPELKDLQKFLPLYYGVQQVNVNGDKFCYIKLENLVAGFTNPSIMDIKIGQVTSDPYADHAKVQREALKYMFQMELGFRVLGSKCYRVKSGKTEFHDKTLCKKLTPDDIPKHISYFLDLENVPARSCLVDKIIQELKKLRTWFAHQKRVRFFSSSILIAFDGQKEHYDNETNKQTDDGASSDVVIRMIDFPHTYIDLNDTQSFDTNYLYGLNKLIQVFENLELN